MYMYMYAHVADNPLSTQIFDTFESARAHTHTHTHTQVGDKLIYVDMFDIIDLSAYYAREVENAANRHRFPKTEISVPIVPPKQKSVSYQFPKTEISVYSINHTSFSDF